MDEESKPTRLALDLLKQAVAKLEGYNTNMASLDANDASPTMRSLTARNNDRLLEEAAEKATAAVAIIKGLR